MKKLIKALIPYLRPHRAKVFTALALTVPLAAIKGYQAYLVKPIIDKGLSGTGSFEEALWLAGLLFAMALLNYPARFFHFYLLRFVVDRATCDIRDELCKKYQNLPMSFFSAQKQGEMVSVAMNDTVVLAQGFRGLVDLVREPLTALFYVGLLFYNDVQLTFAVMVTIPLLILIFRKSGKLVRSYVHQVQGAIANMTHNISEGLAGQKMAKAFNLQPYMITRFMRSQEYYFEQQMKTTWVEENAHPLVELVGALAFCGVILFAHHRIVVGALTTGNFIGFVTALALLMDPIRKFSQANVKMGQARAAFERIREHLDLNEEKVLSGHEADAFFDSLMISNLSFSYGNEKVINNISLEIKKGEKIALVGPSGSGKSTLINLLLRLYNVPNKSIFLDNSDINKLSLQSLRANFGLVSQDVFLINDSVRENLCLGHAFPEDKLRESLEVAGAWDFVQNLPKGLETILGDRGMRLSGGQAQRLTIARAFLFNPPILLFDEATSALDNQSEKVVQQALDRLAGGKTVIAVAHRLTTIQNFDRIYVFHEGQIIEQGNHAELMNRQGEYARLYQLSSL